MLPEDAILLPERVDAIFLVAIHPASQGQPEEVQSVGHGRRLHGSDTAVTHVISGMHSPRPFSRTIRGRRLRDRRGAGCDGRHPTGQDGERLWAPPAVARAGSDDHVGEDSRTAPVEEGVRVPSSEPGGECVLPIQVHHRR